MLAYIAGSVDMFQNLRDKMRKKDTELLAVHDTTLLWLRIKKYVWLQIYFLRLFYRKQYILSINYNLFKNKI